MGYTNSSGVLAARVAFLEPGFDRGEPGADLLGKARVELVPDTAPGSVADSLYQRGGDRGGHDGQESDPTEHDDSADRPPGSAARDHVAVADCGDRLQGPPQARAETAEVPGVGDAR